MARPKLQKNAKTSPLVVHLPVPFKNRVLAAARKSEKPISQWVRETLTKHVPSSAPPPRPAKKKAAVKAKAVKAKPAKRPLLQVGKPVPKMKAAKSVKPARVRKPYVKPSVVTTPAPFEPIDRATPIDLGDEHAA